MKKWNSHHTFVGWRYSGPFTQSMIIDNNNASGQERLHYIQNKFSNDTGRHVSPSDLVYKSQKFAKVLSTAWVPNTIDGRTEKESSRFFWQAILTIRLPASCNKTRRFSCARSLRSRLVQQAMRAKHLRTFATYKPDHWAKRAARCRVTT